MRGTADRTEDAIRPLAAVVSCSRTMDGRAVQAVSDRFLEPMSTVSGLTPVIVPALPRISDARSIARRLDALVLTGSCSNVSPGRYGSSRPQRGRSDEGRDEVALALAAEMISAGKPVFGICRGLEELNVLLGGTLDDDVASSRSPIHHPQDATYVEALLSHRHDVLIRDGAFGRSRHASVVSAHHQGIDRLAAGLTIEATAPDGLVEAFSCMAPAPVLAVQWHPEWNVSDEPEGALFYDLLGRAARGEPLAA